AVQPVRHLVGTQGHVPVGVLVLVLLTDDPQCGSVGPGLGDLVEMIERPVERFRSWPGEHLVRGGLIQSMLQEQVTCGTKLRRARGGSVFDHHSGPSGSGTGPPTHTADHPSRLPAAWAPRPRRTVVQFLPGNGTADTRTESDPKRSGVFEATQPRMKSHGRAARSPRNLAIGRRTGHRPVRHGT